jgi:hypothetical protein
MSRTATKSTTAAAAATRKNYSGGRVVAIREKPDNIPARVGFAELDRSLIKKTTSVISSFFLLKAFSKLVGRALKNQSGN